MLVFLRRKRGFEVRVAAPDLCKARKAQLFAVVIPQMCPCRSSRLPECVPVVPLISLNVSLSSRESSFMFF